VQPPAPSPDRPAVWSALSELFLDTDTALGRSARAERLARSPYTLAQLEAILIHEVQPVCSANLHTPAGEWAGFDADTLAARIQAHLGSHGHRWLRRWLPGRVHPMVRDEWQATANAVIQRRRRE